MDTKSKVELRVCRRFVRLYNNKFNTDFEKPTLNKPEPPDCKTRSISNPQDVLELEVTKSSPEEEEDFGKRGKSGDKYFFPKDIPLKVNQLYEDIKKKADKYKKRPDVKIENLTLLLQKSFIKVTEKDIQRMLPTIKRGKWQKKLHGLGFKEIWYVAANEIYRLFPSEENSSQQTDLLE